MRKTAAAVLSVLISTSASFSTAALAGPQWTQFSSEAGVTAFLDRNSAMADDRTVRVRVMRSYDEPVDLGLHPQTREPLYRHGSVKVTYVVDCSKGVIAMAGFQLFSGALGDGDVVWADNLAEQADFAKPVTLDERFALANGCAVQSASKARPLSTAAAETR